MNKSNIRQWLYWLDPLAYGFESLLANEFHGKQIDCVGVNLVPNGASYTDLAYQSCAGVRGAIRGQTTVLGDNYLASLSYYHSHVWRNVGINWAWWVLYVGITVWATDGWSSSAQGGYLLIPREKAKHNQHHTSTSDLESQVREKAAGSSNGSSTTPVEAQLIRNTSVFTWKNLTVRDLPIL